jgi:hypothetical protein
MTKATQTINAVTPEEVAAILLREPGRPTENMRVPRGGRLGGILSVMPDFVRARDFAQIPATPQEELASLGLSPTQAGIFIDISAAVSDDLQEEAFNIASGFKASGGRLLACGPEIYAAAKTYYQEHYREWLLEALRKSAEQDPALFSLRTDSRSQELRAESLA